MLSESCLVECGLRNVYYVPNFITEQEEKHILRKISESPALKWRNVSNRRLQTWGGDITSTSGSTALIPSSMPPYLSEYPDILSRLRDIKIFKDTEQKAPNHVILNQYPPGQGIMPHEDGPSYYPSVATISLGSHAVMNYYRYKPNDTSESNGMRDAANGYGPRPSRAIDQIPVASLLLEPRSLVVTTDDLYTYHLHGIDDVTVDSFERHPLEVGPLSTGAENEPWGTEPARRRVRIDNWDGLGDSRIREIVRNGGDLERGTRTSLTCRVVERVMKGATGVLGKR